MQQKRLFSDGLNADIIQTLWDDFMSDFITYNTDEFFRTDLIERRIGYKGLFLRVTGIKHSKNNIGASFSIKNENIEHLYHFKGADYNELTDDFENSKKTIQNHYLELMQKKELENE